MNVHVLEREQVLPGSPDDVFGFFADARNLEAIFDFRRQVSARSTARVKASRS